MEDLNYEENGNVFPILRRKHASFLRRLTETSRITYGNCNERELELRMQILL